MPESSPDNRFSFSDSQGETTSWQPPLGLQHPLVTSNPLGQNFLSPQFLSPLGTQPLGGGNPLGTSAQALPDYNLSENFFPDSPSLAESQLSLNPSEAPVTAAATPTAGMDSTQVNIQRYPAETPTANGHDNNPIPAASDSLSEAERRLLGHDTQATTEEEQVASQPHEQLRASDTTPFNPTVVQPQLATEPFLEREIAIPETPEAVEPSRESLLSESEPSVQIPEVAEEPSAIANANPSVMRSADLSNVPPPQTSPVAPLASLPADHLSGIEPIVSSQGELSPVHAIEPAKDTEQNTQDVPSVPVQRQEDEASPASFLPSPTFPDASQPPQSLVQTKATADLPPPLNQPTAESPPAIAPVLASDNVNVQPSVQPNSDSESVAIAETSDFPPSTAGASATQGESLEESGITPSEPTVVQAFAETESSALSQTASAPLESSVLTEPERYQSSIIGEPVADSSTPLATPELETITPSSSPTLEEPHQRTETPRVDTDTAPSHSEIVQPRLERETSAQSEAALAPASDATTHPEPLVSSPSSVIEVSESPLEATPATESEPTIAQLFSEPESSDLSEAVSLQDNEASTPSIPTTPTAALSTPVNEPIANALPSSTESGATQTNIPEPVVQPLPEGEAIDVPQNAVLETPNSQLISETAPTVMKAEAVTLTNIPEPVVQPLPEGQAIDAPPNAVLETPDSQLISETVPTFMKAEEVHQEVQQGASIVEDTGEEVQQEENSSATPLLTSDTASTPSAISTNLLQRSTTADESSEVAATPESLSTPVESTAQLPQLTADESSQVAATPESLSAPMESTAQLPELSADESSQVAATPKSISAPVESTAQLPELALETTTVSETERKIPVTQDESLLPNQQQPIEVTQPDEMTVAPKLEAALTRAESQPIDTNIASAPPESVTQSIESEEGSVVQPLLETESSAQNQTALPAIHEPPQFSELTEPSLDQPASISEPAEINSSPETPPLLPSVTTPTNLAVVQPSLEAVISEQSSEDLRQLSEPPSPELSVTAGKSEPTVIAPTQEEASAHPDITSPTSPQESGIQRQALAETQETAPEVIAPTQEEAIAHPDITSPTSPQESSIQRQLLSETEETAPDVIAPTQEEAIAHSDITSPTSPQESSIQRQLLPETAPVQTASTPSASETELSSSINPAITTDSTLVMPKALPDQATPVPYPTQPEPLQPTEIAQLDENTSLTEPIIAQPLLESDTNLQSERLPTANNSEEAQDNSPQVSPASLNNSSLPAHLLQTKTNVTEDESFNQNQDVPQLPTVLENLVGTRHTLSLIQPLNQQSSLLSTASTPEFSREQPTIVQSMPETSPRLVVPSTTPSALPEDAFNQALQSTVKVPPVSLDTEPLTLQRATDAIPKTTPESNQETQQVGSSTYTSEIPSSWFSIADLLENTTTNSSSAFGGKTPIQMAFNDGTNQESFDLQESNTWENLIPEYSRSSEASLTFSQETPIQRFTTEDPPLQDDASAAEPASQPQDAQQEDEQNLEILAREIYSLVQQRLAIERERYGHYS